MLDLLLRNATLPDGRSGQDIACKDGRIVDVKPKIDGAARATVDAKGYLVSPPFIDSHFHMDATLSLGLPRLNMSGTLLEGISLWGELKPILTHEAVIERALRYCDLAVTQGLLAIRTHVDVCDDRLLCVEALLEVRRKIAPYIDLQLVAFPQDGFYRDPHARRNLIRALDMGVDVVGGIPHFERTMADGAASLKELCEIAANRGLLVDIHCDTSMHSMDNYYVSKLIPLMAEAELHATPNPLINITLQGRHDTYPKRRGMTRVPELRAAGINVSFGHDCVMDPWYPLGQGDMLEAAYMGIHAAPMTSREAMRWAFDAVTVNPAKAMHLQGYGLEKGCNADFVVLQAKDPIDAIRLKANRLAVVRRGKVIAETPERVSALHLAGRPATINGADFAPPAGGR
ncbi:MAG: amidohydrolase family protein [Alphaproteobacteria bacterium]|nr:amidohydrolase family protein [Alphaproteobacteria bacterium]